MNCRNIFIYGTEGCIVQVLRSTCGHAPIWIQFFYFDILALLFVFDNYCSTMD